MIDECSRTTVARLDLNENPFGPPAGAVRRVQENLLTLHQYPHQLRDDVTTAVAREFEVATERVLLTSGVDEAIDLVLSLVDTAWCLVPGFDGYYERARALGRAVGLIGLDAEWQPSGKLPRLSTRDAVFIARPHNPTGNVFSSDWMEAAATSPCYTMVDETYLDFTGRPSYVPRVDEFTNLLVFKSFSKSYGLAGARVGALIGQPALVATLAGRQRFQSVDSVALHALDGALQTPGHRSDFIEYVRRARLAYQAALRDSELFAEVRSTETNFLVARCKSPIQPPQLVQALHAHGVRVRDCTSLGLSGWVRVSIGSPSELRQLRESLAAVDQLWATHAIPEVVS